MQNYMACPFPPRSILGFVRSPGVPHVRVSVKSVKNVCGFTCALRRLHKLDKPRARECLNVAHMRDIIDTAGSL